MSQNDLVIANQSFPATRADINSALQALGSLNSGATAPSTTYANMLWYDTANNILKMRSEADDAWINIGTLNQSTNTFTPSGVAELSQAQAEDDTSTVFGQVSGQRLAQAGLISFTNQEQQIGVGQTWQSVISSRTTNVWYQNTTGKPIFVSIRQDTTVSAGYIQVSVDTTTIIDVGLASTAAGTTNSFVVPDGWYYRTNDGSSITQWSELR